MLVGDMTEYDSYDILASCILYKNESANCVAKRHKTF